MKTALLRYKLVVALALFGGLVATVYSLVSPKVYLVSSRAAIFRMKVENPDSASDEARNRWIWIRDGLNVSSALLSDKILTDFLKTSGATFKMEGADEYSRLKNLRDMIKVQFTGADENNYILEVRTQNTELGLAFNQFILDHLKFLAVEKDQQDFEKILLSLQEQVDGLGKNSPELAYYQDKIMKLKFEHTLAQTQKENVFQVISEPTVVTHPIWPKTKALVVLGLLFGGFVGGALEFLRHWSRKK